MKNKTIIESITQGMYVLTTDNAGCIVDAVSQISSGENPLISVSVMKKNYTNEMLKKNTMFSISILSENASSGIIETFGMHSMRDYSKFEKVETINVEGIPIIKNSTGYMVCEIVDKIENDTHTLFIGRVIRCDRFNNEKPMSYAYYKEHKDEILKKVTILGKTAWVCSVCGYVYYGDTIPDDYKCPICGVSKEKFEKK